MAFKIGDTVIQKATGKEYVVDGFNCCPGCGDPTIYLKGVDWEGTLSHVGNANGLKGCGYESKDVTRAHFSKALFEKPASFGELSEYRLKVSAPELTEIKEIQNH